MHCKVILTCLFIVAFESKAVGDDAAVPPIQRMVDAAHVFVASLDDAQREKAVFPFDDEERLEYKTAPFPSGGIKYDELNQQQRVLLHGLLNASLGAQGYGKASGVIALEGYLVEREKESGRVSPLHGIDKYTTAVFGTPSMDGAWGWRIQGHHLSLNFTVVDGEFYASGPAFLGAEPHYVAEGPREGWHVLGREENLGRGLMESLNAEQRAPATIADEMPPDMFTGSSRKASFEGGPKGIAYADLTSDQQQKVRALVLEYVNNIPRELAYTRLDVIEQGGWDAIHFGWIGSPQRGERNYYRLEGPEFIIEYCAVALSPNHVHTVWRDKEGDFGRDLLAEHMQAFAH